jgi:acyl-CoA thioester hydrolase
MEPSFAFTIRVYYEDTDAVGVVYHANYVKFLERARTEWLRSLGIEQNALAQSHGVIFVVRSAAIEFLKPARFDDVIDVEVRVTARGGASVTFAQTIQRADELLCQAEVRVAALNAATLAPCALPPALAAQLKEICP